MAPLSPPKNTASPSKPLKNHPKVTLKGPRDDGAGEEPPLKKRKYAPGGPNGEGGLLDADENEVNVEDPVSSACRSSSNSRSRPELGTEAHSVQLPPLPHPTSAPAPVPAPAPTTPPPARPKREKSQSQNQGRFTSSSAAALALQHGDGYKPREERGWEEFHPELDIDGDLAVFSAEEVDAPMPSELSPNGESINGSHLNGEILAAELQHLHAAAPSPTPPKRRPGRPPRRPNAMLDGLGTPNLPKSVPLPGPNPQEKLTLPKPSFRLRDPFDFYDRKGIGQQNYVDRTMASVGYQESDIFLRHERQLIRNEEGMQEDDIDTISTAANDGEVNMAVGRVEYDMDEQDEKWLEDYNARRREEELEPIKPAIFEITMTKIEKEWHALEKRIPKPNPKPPQTQRPRSSSAAAVNGEPAGPGEEQDSRCAICDDGDCENSNAIVFCDGCDLAVHQECYGVPYIPEGQWLCRKCQLIGRGTVNCIFCPNTEGAFKQTTTSKWAHLLCSIWIPEVSLGNPTLMEPITDIEKVPRSRWKLLCYICRQRMGASIQCSNKNCFVAFHVTCARRSQLYLKMKAGHGTPAIMDSQLLKAFCDKHVPPEWRREHGTDVATADAIEYYRNTMQGRRWGDSQAAALALEPSHPLGSGHMFEESPRHMPRITLTVGGNKRKRLNPPKTVWKLPSGAPIIPQVLLNSVVASLQRFCVRHRKQFAEDACKYWTLKREARRGAALLKRLQLQLETFSSMEMTRRDYVAMGVAGGKRLQSRIDFGERLYVDLDRIRMLCDEVKKREREKLKDAETLRGIVDLVYFPIFPLLWPIFEKTQAYWFPFLLYSLADVLTYCRLDGKGVFRRGLSSIRKKLEERFYTSVSGFSAHLASVFTSEIGVQPAGDTAELQMQMGGRAPELSLEQREKRKLAKRIIKAIQPALEEAIKNESELNRKPFENELKDLDCLLEGSVRSHRGSRAPDAVDDHDQLGAPDRTGHNAEDSEMFDANAPETAEISETPQVAAESDAPTAELESAAEDQDMFSKLPATTPPAETDATVNGDHKEDSISPQPSNQPPVSRNEPLTPPLSSQDDQQLPLAQGGLQWYVQPFDPVGTTIHEERWTGRDVMRSMSEELSELDEDELKDLVDDEPEQQPAAASNKRADDAPPAESPVKVHRTRRRWRGFK